MSLITETGTGDSTAESYASVTDADTYQANRGNDTWPTISTLQKEQALRRATDYMMGEYRGRWLGYRVTTTQALDWPRNSVVTNDGHFNSYGYIVVSYTIVPNEVKNACIELALRAAAGELLSDQERGTLEEGVGPVKIKYDINTKQRTIFPQIDAMLKVYLKNSGNGAMVKLTRT
jgi:hypothetical protein